MPELQSGTALTPDRRRGTAKISSYKQTVSDYVLVYGREFQPRLDGTKEW